MEYQAIRYAVVDGIASITLNRPERRNALDLAMRNELARAIGEIRRDKNVRAVIIAGAGNSFCAGGDLASMQGAIPDAAAGRDRLRSNIDWLQEWVMLDRPVIAAVDGHAAGAGFNLALAADFILATPEARFAQSFARVGLVPISPGCICCRASSGCSAPRNSSSRPGPSTPPRRMRWASSTKSMAARPCHRRRWRWRHGSRPRRPMPSASPSRP